MPYDHDYVCMMKEPVVCELCNKSYAIGRMKAHKQTKMHKENAEKCGVPSSWWFMGGTKPNAFVGRYNKQLAQSTPQNPPAHPSANSSAHPSAHTLNPKP
jgi:hypothetical protein